MIFWLIHSDKKDAKDKEEAGNRRQGNRKSKETLNKSDCRFFSVNYNVANCPQHKELRQFDGKCGLIASSVNQHFP
ncbi:MAG: hypothetical protein IJ630_06480, partial [Treponema sp.]|nr:hypothetical protein [Treponema sp.]